MMAGAQGNFNLPFHVNRFLVNGQEQEADEEIELSLDLSSNGRFGMDPNRNVKKLKRSSSISNMFFAADAVDSGVNGARAAFQSYGTLMRTSSLPADPPEEWRRRKELQTMRRMEARKKRMEKLKNVRIGKDKENSTEENGYNRSPGVVIGNTAADNGIIGSKERVSSGIPEFQRQHAEGVTQRAAELKCTSSVPSSPNPIPPRTIVNQKQSPQRTIVGAAVTEDANEATLKNVMLDMPLVSTRETGPNGARVQGLLYRYKKRDEGVFGLEGRQNRKIE
ncbi:ninja-family protein AFP3-like isoform X2 [Olea europaea var. sylvestris]|uniref:ninja-family protein AFP3-like isoform X2 n=1 Tax=Olea europaea var. sylvestris TaxID=158386 RepID=UPI000C1CDB54|nr:ninja-family protein AFP3-like isoform X2 [Olea europaea var. sylvestris]